MGINNNPFGGIVELGLIASGGDSKNGDHPKDESSNQKVILPGTHDPKNVKQDHLAFSPIMTSPTALGQQTFHGALDPGTLVYFMKLAGQNGGLILGQANDLVNYDKGEQGGAEGGKDLLGAEYFQKLFDRETDVNIPPDIEDAEVNGAKVKRVKEKKKKHKHSLLKGLPSHGASHAMSGFRIPEVKDVPTAKQQFSDIMSNDMLSQLPGQIMSLGSMFQGLGFGGGGGDGQGGGQGQGGGGTGGNAGTGEATGAISINYADGILANVSPDIADAITNMATLCQNYESSGALGSYSTGFRVHPETFLENAAQLFNQATSVSDVMDICHRLQHDEDLFGLDQLENVVLQIESIWGAANVIISGLGEVVTEFANSSPISDFSSQMQSPQQNPGSGSGQNMFGDKIQNLMDMMQRLAPEAQQKMQKVMGEMNSDMDIQQIIKQTIEGGNPLSKFMNF